MTVILLINLQHGFLQHQIRIDNIITNCIITITRANILFFSNDFDSHLTPLCPVWVADGDRRPSPIRFLMTLIVKYIGNASNLNLKSDNLILISVPFKFKLNKISVNIQVSVFILLLSHQAILKFNYNMMTLAKISKLV